MRDLLFVELTLISPLFSHLLPTSEAEKKEKKRKSFRCAFLDFPQVERYYNSVSPTYALEGREAEKKKKKKTRPRRSSA